MWKRIGIVFGVLFLIPLLQAQVGPTVFTPRLTVSPGDLTVTTGNTTVQNLTVSGTCTGCGSTSPGGADTQVQFNNAGAFGGDADLTFSTATNTLTATNIAGNGSALTNLDAGDIATGTLAVARGGTGTTTSTGTGSTVLSAAPTLTGTTTAAAMSVTGALTAGTVNGITTTDWARLSQANTFTGASGVIPGSVHIQTNTPVLSFAEADSSANNTLWARVIGAEQLVEQVINDAQTVSTNYLIVNRTGTTVDSVNIAATNVQANGSNICTANGTNCPAGSSTIESPTCNGFSSTTACAMRWTDLGAQLCATVSVAGTSNATTFTMTGFDMPDPVYTPNNSSPLHITDNGVGAITLVSVSSDGQTLTFTYGAGFLTNGFTASGSKGASGSFCFGITP